MSTSPFGLPNVGMFNGWNGEQALKELVETRYYGTFLASSCNAGDGFRWTNVYASGITNATAGGSGSITFDVAAAFAVNPIFLVEFSVGFGASAGTIQPTYNGSNVAVEYRALANGDAHGSFMITASGSQALALVNTSGGARTPTGTITIRRVTWI
jgi:hypothetical protein